MLERAFVPILEMTCLEKQLCSPSHLWYLARQLCISLLDGAFIWPFALLLALPFESRHDHTSCKTSLRYRSRPRTTLCASAENTALQLPFSFHFLLAVIQSFPTLSRGRNGDASPFIAAQLPSPPELDLQSRTYSRSTRFGEHNIGRAHA